MKEKKSISLLQIGINVILFFHIIMVLVIFWGARSSWYQTEIDSKDLIGATKTYYGTTFGGIIKRSFEYVYEQSDSLNPERHLYSTDIAHLESRDKTNNHIKLTNVENKISDKHIDVPLNCLPLTVPVNHAQKKALIYFVIGISVLIMMYSFLIFYQLRRFVKSVLSHKAFIRQNIHILYSIGVLVVVVPVMKYIIETLELKWIENHFNFPNYSIQSDISFHFSLLGLGFLIISVAEVVRQGVKMKNEHQLTI